MTSIPKTYEGTTYVAHTVERVPLRRSPVKRWKVVIETETPEGMLPLPFDGFLDIDVALPARSHARYVDTFVDGMVKRWIKRTSAPTDWSVKLREDLLEAVRED